MATDNYVYVENGTSGFTRYALTANAGEVTPDLIGWGDKSTLEDIRVAFEENRVISMVPSNGDLDSETGFPVLQFVQRYVDRVVYAVSWAVQNVLHCTSPQTGAAYYNRLSACSCKIMKHIFENSGLNIGCKVVIVPANPSGSLKNWKVLLCTVARPDALVTFSVDVLHRVFQELNGSNEENVSPVMYICAGSGNKDNFVNTPRIVNTSWCKDESGATVVTYCKYLAEPDIRRVVKHSPSGRRSCWEVKKFVEVDEEYVKSRAPRQFSNLKAKSEKSGGGVTPMHFE